MNSNIPNIPVEKFEFVQKDQEIFDTKFETKPVGYFLDAWYRFRRNKGSLVAALIILVLLIFAIFVPMLSRHGMSEIDLFYSFVLPKNNLVAKMGFWDGCKTEIINQQMYDFYCGMPGAIIKVNSKEDLTDGTRSNTYYNVKTDSYAKVAYQYKIITKTEFDALREYENKSGIQVLYPMIDKSKITSPQFKQDSNFWYKANARGLATRDANGNLQPNFLKAKKPEESIRNDGLSYFKRNNETQYEIRVKYDEYYNYINGYYPEYLFGCDSYGQDILVRLAGGARFSFLLGVFVAVTNIIIGVCIGSFEGYYGGAFDLIIERLKDILGSVPFIVVATLFQMHLARKVGVIGCLFFAFILTGWMGVSGRTRTQFYRFKGEEYVLAARTLGAKDNRLIFKHILPNGIGTLITSCILMIPSVIFQESFLSYLGIINLQSASMTSIGTLLSNGQGVLATYPHVIFYPAAFISLLMLSFNIFGNGLRDAFNPSLRGAE